MAYGYPGDATGDSNSLLGIGDRDNQLLATSDHQSVALTEEGRMERFGVGGKSTGRSFVEDGHTFYDDDTAPTDFTYNGQARHNSPNLVDVFDPDHPPDKEGRASVSARKEEPTLYTPHTQEEWDQIYGVSDVPRETPKPEDDPTPPFEQFRKKFPEDNDVKDDDILSGMHKRMDPDNIIAPDKFATLARSQNGWKAIQNEVDKGMNGLQRLRKIFPEASEKSDDDFLLPIYNKMGSIGQLDTRITSFSDFKEQMSPQSGIVNSAWKAWKAMAAGSSSVAHQISGALTNIANSPQAFASSVYQLMDKLPDQPGTQVKTLMGQANDLMMQAIAADPDPGMPSSQYAAAINGIPKTNYLMNWLNGMVNAQQHQAQVDKAREQNAVKAGGLGAKVAGYAGEAGTGMGIKALLFAIPGANLRSAVIATGVVEGLSHLTAAVQAHHDNALIESIAYGGMSTVYRHLWNSPNGRVLTAFTTWAGDTGEDNVQKLLRGEHVDWIDAVIGAGIDLGIGWFAGRKHEYPRYHFQDPKGYSFMETLPDTPESAGRVEPDKSQLLLGYPETFTSGSVTESREQQKPVTKSWQDEETERLMRLGLRGEDFISSLDKREKQAQGEEITLPHGWKWETSDHTVRGIAETPDGTRVRGAGVPKPRENLERGFVTHAAAAQEELSKALEARSNGDNNKATEHLDRALSTLPVKEQKDFAKAVIKFAHDATKNNGETMVDKAVKKPVQIKGEVLPPPKRTWNKGEKITLPKGWKWETEDHTVKGVAVTPDLIRVPGSHVPKSSEKSIQQVDEATEIINSHFYGLGNIGERGATLNWPKEIADWFDNHWKAAIQPGQAKFKPQSLGPEAETMWQKAKFRTSEAQQAAAAIPVQIAKALHVDNVIRGGEKVDRRAAAFGTQSDAQLKEILATTEEGDVHTGNPQIDWIMNDFWKTVNQAMYRNERAANFDHPEVPDYFPQWWKEKRPNQFQEYWDRYRTTPAWTKHRKFPTWRQGFNAGFEPAILNPERIGQARLWSHVNNIKKVMTLRDAAKAGAAIAKEGLSKEERKALEDNPEYTDIMAPNKEAYFLKHTAKQVVNIAWEPSKLFREGVFGFDAPAWKLSAATKGITARQLLGLSFAHLIHVTSTWLPSIEAGLTRVALSAPDKAKAFRNVFKALAKNPRSSFRILNAWRGYETLTHPDEIRMLEDIKRMGLNLGTNEEAMMQFSENLRRWMPDWLRKAPMPARNLIETGYHALDAIMDWQFGVAIPFLKTSAALHDLQVIYNTRPDLMKPGKEEALKTEIAKHGDTIDTRFGEMNMANLFWSKVIKDIGKSVFLAFGWQINVAKFFGQAVHDMTTNMAYKAWLHARGKAHEPFITDHMLFTFYYTSTIMALNAARQFLFTGQPPEGKDYLVPRIGKDEQGNWIRARPIEFTTEAAILAHHIDKEGGWTPFGITKGVGTMALNKLNPAISDTVTWWGNKNYFGQEYYNELDPWYTQLWDTSTQMLQSGLTPIPLQDMWGHTGHPLTLGGFFTSMFGLPRAPSWADRTQNENRIADTYHRMFPRVSTPESTAMSNAHQALAAAIRDKDDNARMESVKKLREMGASDQGIKMTIKRAHELPGDVIKYYFKEIGKKFPEYQEKLFQLMNPEEQKTYQPLLGKAARKQLQPPVQK